MRKFLLLAALAAFLALFNHSALQKEKLMEGGMVMYLKTAPFDPRALLLGDYMDLDFEINREATAALYSPAGQGNPPREGAIIVALDERGVAFFKRLEGEGEGPAENEYRLRYRVDNRRAQVTAAAFFFQEGHAKDYEAAKYGEIRVDTDGGTLLTHLLDRDLRRIAPQKEPR